jgi:hypothetical protein
MGRDSLAILVVNTPDGDRRTHHVFGHVARHTLILGRDLPLWHVGHQTVGILPEHVSTSRVIASVSSVLRHMLIQCHCHLRRSRS